MEKLIELLKEYAPEDFNWCAINGKIFDSDRCGTIMNVEMGVYVISKQFGFIKWLVDNDKIEVTNIWRLPKKLYINNDGITCVDDMCEDCYYNAYESLLMLLAIQDEPIEFLCSILK